MAKINIFLDKKLLAAADRAARRKGQSRCALVRDAIRSHLRTMDIQDLEERDRKGYESRPQTADEWAI